MAVLVSRRHACHGGNSSTTSVNATANGAPRGNAGATRQGRPPGEERHRARQGDVFCSAEVRSTPWWASSSAGTMPAGLAPAIGVGVRSTAAPQSGSSW